ncbi:MAG: tetratricopeptide repeat protein [Gammaproteobacteria bacterium]|nr:tetratricopeptide repeat protein [Gammaproteobacteria bacterium]
MDTLGSLLIMQGDRERGQRLVADAAKRAPGDLGIQLNYAKVLADQGRKGEAKQLLQGIVERAGDAPVAVSAKAALDAL